MRRLPLCLILLLIGAVPAQSAEPLRFADLTGWWTADPQFAGESSRVVLHLLEEEGKPMARLSIVAIGGYDFPLGSVEIDGNTLDSKPFSFPLQYDRERDVLTGHLPKDAVPVYRIPVEFRRSEPYARPRYTDWSAPRPTLRWTLETGSPAWAGIERDADSGLIYVANDAGLLHAIDPVGAVRWKFAAEKPIKARPAVLGDSVYVVADSGYVHRLDKRSGAERWRARVDTGSPARIPPSQPDSRWDRYGSSVAADAERLYVASRDKHLYAIEIASGKQVWRVAADDIMTATPALHRDNVLMADFAGKIRAVDARTGKVQWTYDALLPVAGDLVVAGDRVLAGSRTYELIALDARTGKEDWKHYYWFSWIESPPVVRDGVVYTGSSDATQVYAIDLASGNLRWKTAVPGWAWAQTAVNEDLVIAATAGVGEYPGYRAGALLALDRSSGAMHWMFLEPPSAETIAAKKGWGFGAAPLVADGVVYAVDLNGRVYAFDSKLSSSSR